jgi:hypothetical protein
LFDDKSDEFNESRVNKTLPVEADKISESNSAVSEEVFFSLTAPLNNVPLGMI